MKKYPVEDGRVQCTDEQISIVGRLAAELQQKEKELKQTGFSNIGFFSLLLGMAVASIDQDELPFPREELPDYVAAIVRSMQSKEGRTQMIDACPDLGLSRSEAEGILDETFEIVETKTKH